MALVTAPPPVCLPLRLLLPAVLAGVLLSAAAWAEDPAAPAPPPSEAARLASIRSLGKQIRKAARGPWAVQKKPEIVAMLDALVVLGGPASGAAALEAVVLADPEVRDKAFGHAEAVHASALVAPLALLLEDKDRRDDVDLRRRVARSLSVMADPSAMGPLTGLIRTDEAPEVVAVAADSLATYSSAPLPPRKEAVRRLVDLYESTWNLMMSIRPEDRVMAAKMQEQWGIYGRSVRAALQALTGEQALTRPQEWRDWWNDNKKRTDW